MGRHSSADQVPFYRSVAGWVIPWALIAAVVGAAVWIAVGALGGPPATSPAALSSTGSRPTASPTAAPTSTPAPSPVHTHAARKSPKASPQASPTANLITQGITVQVLNGTNDPSADDRMANKLTKLGYQVIAISPASIAYSQTTVYWAVADAKPAAQALAQRFGWVAEPKPGNLSNQVDLHVVVGADAG
jgi:hypothetical protein